MYSFGALLSFTIAHASVSRLRAKRPDVARPYRGPRQRAHPRLRRAAVRARRRHGVHGDRVRRDRRAQPRTSAIGGSAGCSLGIVVYPLYRRRQGLDLASTHKVAIPQPVVDHEAEYDSVLVHFGDDRLRRADARDRGQAGRAQAPRDPRAGHDHRPERAARSTRRCREEEAAADSIIEQAKLQGGGRVSGHWEKVRAGQAGRRIIEEAQDMRAAAVVMTLPRRIAGTSVFGKTVETVLAERPCRVIIESRPPAPRGRRTRPRRLRCGREPDHAAPLRPDGAARRRDDRAHDRRGRRRGGGRDRPRRAVRRRGRRPPLGGAAAMSAARDGGRRRLQRLEAPPALKRGIGSPPLFGIVQGFLSASLYFALGVVVVNALGLTWLVLLVATLFCALLVLSYMEGASLHQERGGATVIARYGFNELWSFVAGWAILLDYLILIAISAFATTDYVAVFWGELSRGRAGADPRVRRDRLRRLGQHARRRLAALGARRGRRLRRPRAAAADRRARARAAVRARGADRPGRDRRHAGRPRTCCSRSRSRSRRSPASTPRPRWPARSRSRAAASSACSPRARPRRCRTSGIALVAVVDAAADRRRAGTRRRCSASRRRSSRSGCASRCATRSRCSRSRSS